MRYLFCNFKKTQRNLNEKVDEGASRDEFSRKGKLNNKINNIRQQLGIKDQAYQLKESKRTF